MGLWAIREEPEKADPAVLSQDDVNVLLRFSAVTSLHLSDIRAASGSTLHSLFSGLGSLVHLSVDGNLSYDVASWGALSQMDGARLLKLQIRRHHSSPLEYQSLFEYLQKTKSVESLQTLVVSWTYSEDRDLTQYILDWGVQTLSHLTIKLGRCESQSWMDQYLVGECQQAPLLLALTGRAFVDPLPQQCLRTSSPIVSLQVDLPGHVYAPRRVMRVLANVKILTIKAIHLRMEHFPCVGFWTKIHACFGEVGSYRDEPTLDWQTFRNLHCVAYHFDDFNIGRVSGTCGLRQRFESAKRRRGVSVLFLPTDIQYDE